MKKTTVICTLLLSVMLACKSSKTVSVKQGKSKVTSVSPAKKGEDFEKFNQKFHTDSAFQLSRVIFPAGGYYLDQKGKKQWTMNNWMVHKTPVGAMSGTTNYKYSLVKSDTSVTEKIWTESGTFSFERNFVLKRKKWYLKYCKNIEG